ncbi:MAG: peroxiredoxin [Candidatus Woesearchaeota archaeon]
MKAPHFTLENTQGEQVSLPKKGLLILYFYPKANTPGCTKEAKKFSELYPEFIKAKAMVWGVSPDPISNVCTFQEKHDFAHTLLADPEHKIAEKYGVWKEKNMYGKKYWGVERTTFVIQDGQILNKFKHRPEKTEEEILEYVQNL